MTDKEMFRTLLLMDDTAASAIIDKAFHRYFDMIAKIAADIYDSGIRDYYFQYDPIIYDRHGNKKGFNLYSANDIYYDVTSVTLDIGFDSDELLKYRGKKDKREQVLNAVLDGFRGGSSRKMPVGWPMTWQTSYPNRFSKYVNTWKSRKIVLRDIIIDFISNGASDTEFLFYQYLKDLM